MLPATSYALFDIFFFFNDTATTEIYTLSLHDALPIWPNNVWIGVSIENEAVQSRIDDLRVVPAAIRFLSLEPLLGPLGHLDLSSIDWVVVGGESGPGARQMKKEWVMQIKEQCIEQNTPFYFKQWGGVRKKKTGRILLNKTWDEMPVCVMS